MARLARRLSLALLLVIPLALGLVRGALPASAITSTTTQLVAATQNPSVAGQLVYFVATVTCSGHSTDGDTVVFFDQFGPIGVGTLFGGFAFMQTTSLSVGLHYVIAEYTGDSNCDISFSNTLNRSVLSPAGGLGLTSSANPSNLGQSVTFSATASCFQTGETITFLDGQTATGTGQLNASGKATFTTSSLTSGQHTITASYPGDISCPPVSSAPLTQIVNGTPTQNGGVLLRSSVNPSRAGSPVTFTATVSCSGFAPVGTATFLDGANPLGTAAVNGAGQASLRVTTLTVGVHTITVNVANTGCGTLTSAPLTQQVNSGFGF